MRRLFLLASSLWLLSLLLMGCSVSGSTGAPPTPTIDQAKLANPAAGYCRDQGYRFETRKDDVGNEYGVCIFDDGSECNAWAYFRGECGSEKAKKLALNLVEAAELDQTVHINIFAPKTSSVDVDVSRQPRAPGMEVIVQIDDPQTIRALLDPLNKTLPLTPPVRCPAPYELQFTLKNGENVVIFLGLCGLHGGQDYWRGMTIRPPEAFVIQFNQLLEQAGAPAK